MHHHHDMSVGWSTGTGWLHVLWVAAVLGLVVTALLRPFLESSGRWWRTLVTILGAGAVVALLVLTNGLDGPRQVVVLAVLVAGLPVLAAVRPGTALARGARRSAPWVVLVATALTLVETARAWLGDPAPVLGAQLVDTAVLTAVVGFSWAALCPVPSWRTARSPHLVAWALGSAVLVGAATAGVTGAAI